MQPNFGVRLPFSGEWQTFPQQAAIAPITISSRSPRNWSDKLPNWIAGIWRPLPRRSGGCH